MTKTDITIPPEVVEAAARAAYYVFTEIDIGDGEDHWERLLPRFRAEYREQARAALLAGLRAWPGMKLTPYWEHMTHKRHVEMTLPLPQQDKQDDKA